MSPLLRGISINTSKWYIRFYPYIQETIIDYLLDIVRELQRYPISAPNDILKGVKDTYNNL